MFKNYIIRQFKDTIARLDACLDRERAAYDPSQSNRPDLYRGAYANRTEALLLAIMELNDNIHLVREKRLSRAEGLLLAMHYRQVALHYEQMKPTAKNYYTF